MARKNNPRRSNGTRRNKYRDRLRSMGLECGICHGRLGPIHYDEPSDYRHPLSFVVDEIRPVSRWKEFGYDSPEQAALDWDNLQAAHWCCNAHKSNNVDVSIGPKDNTKPGRNMKKINLKDGDW